MAIKESRAALLRLEHISAALILLAAISIVLSGPAKGFSRYTQPLQALGDRCAASGQCAGITQYIRNNRPLAEAACQETSSIDAKVELAQPLFRFERVIDELGLDLDSVGMEHICGGLMDPEITNVEVIPEKVVLEVDEVVDLEAVIHCSNGTCTGTLDWTSGNVNVAQVDGDGRAGSVTATGRGKTNIVVISPLLENVQGSAEVTVGIPIVDLVFVIDTSYWHGYWLGTEHTTFGPGLKQHSSEIWRGLIRHFDWRSRVAVVTYNRKLLDPYNRLNTMANCTGDGLWPAEGYIAPAATVTTYAPFEMLSDTLFPEFLSELAVTCAVPRGGYYGAFAYSGLMHALDGEELGSLRDEVDGEPVKTVIVLIARWRPGGDYYDAPVRLNNPEPFSGYTQDTVIQRALEREAEIHIFNTAGENVIFGVPANLPYTYGMEGNREVFMQIASETGGTYIETEYSGLYPGESLYLGIIDAMSEMAR